MSLSDDLLRKPELLDRARKLLQELVSNTGARSAFLIDERGLPFAARGNVEFRLPEPLSGLQGGDLLAALVGVPASPGVLVEPVEGTRALLALLLDETTRSSQARGKARETSAKLASLFALIRDTRELAG